MPVARRKRILLVDSVVWPSNVQPDPRRDVASWFTRWFKAEPSVEWIRVSASDEVRSHVDSRMVDGVLLSGSPRDAFTDDPVNHRLCELVLASRRQSIPVLGVCYGHQILGRALGASVGRHAAGLELGNTPVSLTPRGRTSLLFHGLPDTFDVLSSHVDVVSNLPDGVEWTVAGTFAAIQGLQTSDGLLHGVQFHPETDPDILRLIWDPRRESWRSRVSFDLDHTLDHLQSTPSGPAMLHNFVHRIVP